MQFVYLNISNFKFGTFTYLPMAVWWMNNLFSEGNSLIILSLNIYSCYFKAETISEIGHMRSVYISATLDKMLFFCIEYHHFKDNDYK